MTASFVITLTNIPDAMDPAVLAEELFELLQSEGLVVASVNPWSRPEAGVITNPAASTGLSQQIL